MDEHLLHGLEESTDRFLADIIALVTQWVVEGEHKGAQAPKVVPLPRASKPEALVKVSKPTTSKSVDPLIAKVKRVRRLYGMSQKKVGKLLGYSRGPIALFEQGRMGSNKKLRLA